MLEQLMVLNIHSFDKNGYFVTVDDISISTSSSATLPGKQTSEFPDISSDPIKLKTMNDSDQALFRNNSETGVNEIDVCCSFSKGTETVAICKGTSVSLPYQVSAEQKSSLDEEQSQSCSNGSVNNSEHPQVPVFDKECDHNTVKDIWVDEGVFSQNKNSSISQDYFEVEKHKCFYSTQPNASDVLLKASCKSVACHPDVNNVLDFDSLLELAGTGNNQKQEISDHTGDKSYLDELLASANNPFLEDSPFKTCQGDEKDAVYVAHPSNPFNFDGTLYEPEGNNSTGPDETPNKTSTKGDVIEGVISSKNPFLDTSSFKLAMDDFKKAEKTSGNDVTVEGAAKKELATHDEERKTTGDGKAGVPSITSTVSIQGAGEKMKIPEQCNTLANGSQLQYEPLESSFASMNLPALVSYSGQIPFSGSMSLRSEGSATSNRSFAFPVLQTEWKASPVRMAKADRKHNSWKHTLLCCNF